MVDADDELGVGYGHGVLICGSFTTAGDARLMLEEKVNPDLKKPKSERVFQEAVEPEPRKDQDEADLDFESDANPDFDINDFGSVGPDLAEDEDADASEIHLARGEQPRSNVSVPASLAERGDGGYGLSTVR